MEDGRARGAHARGENGKEMKPRSFRPALVSILSCAFGLLVGVAAEIIGFIGMLLYLLYWWIVAKRSDETPC